MSTILLSIKPEYVSRIFEGTKQYEFRRRPAKAVVTKLLIYATAPISAVVGEAIVTDLLVMPPASLWDSVKSQAGISKNKFFEYFSTCEIAYAYCLGTVRQYCPTISLSAYGLQHPPQSFVYIHS